MIKILTAVQEILLDTLSASFKKEKYLLSADTDLTSIYEESKVQAVVLQVFNSVDTKNVTNTAFLEKWFSISMNYLKNNLAIHSNHNYLHRLMSENNIKSVMDTTMDNLRAMVDADTVVGTPVVMGKVTLIPVSRVSFGLATGGTDFPSKTNQKLFGGYVRSVHLGKRFKG